MNDACAERIVWANVYENGWATYKQMADTIGKCRRVIQKWVAIFRKEGPAGLVDSPRCGAPVKVTKRVIKRIFRLRDDRMKLQDIAQACQISPSSVKKVLHSRKKALQEQQLQLDLSYEEIPSEIAPVVEESIPNITEITGNATCSEPVAHYSDEV